VTLDVLRKMRALLLVPVILAASCDDRSASTPPLEPEEGRKEWESYQEKDQGAQRVSQKDPHDPQQGETLRWREFLRICRDRDLTELQKKTFVLGQRVRWSGQLVAADKREGNGVEMRMGMPLGSVVSVALHESQTKEAVRIQKGEQVVVEGKIAGFGGLFSAAKIVDGILAHPVEAPPFSSWHELVRSSTERQVQMIGKTVVDEVFVRHVGEAELKVAPDGGKEITIPITKKQWMNLRGLTPEHSLVFEGRIAQLHPKLVWEAIHIIRVSPALDPTLQGLPEGARWVRPLVEMREWTAKDGRCGRNCWRSKRAQMTSSRGDSAGRTEAYLRSPSGV
jgi:alkylated DNA nucleotide flippase Atl1